MLFMVLRTNKIVVNCTKFGTMFFETYDVSTCYGKP